MRVARIVFGILASVVGLGLLALAAFYFAQPSSFRIARTRTISASPAVIRAHLEDVRAFEAWQPWAPTPGVTPTVTYSPIASGVGAWIDRRDADGGARTTITSVGDDHVEMRNETSGALASGASVQRFDLRVTPSGTEVTWSLRSELHGLARLLWPVVHLEASAGPRMDEGLTRLDRACRP